MKIHLKNIFTIVRICIALGLLSWLVYGMDFTKISHLNGNAILYCIGITILLMSLQISFGAYRWKILLEAQGYSISLWRAISLSFQGNAFSLFMPEGAVGGDIIKAALIAVESEKGKGIEGITTVALDRLIGMPALFLPVLLLAVFQIHRIRVLPSTIQAGIVLLLVFCLIGIIFIGCLFFQDIVFRIKLLNLFLKKIEHLCDGKISRILNAITLYRKRRMALLKAFVISLCLVHPLLLSTFFCILYILNASVPDFAGSYLSIALANSAAVIPVTPGGLGTRDKIAQELLISFGVETQSTILAPLFFSTGLMSIAIMGLLLFFIDSISLKKKR